MFEDLENWWDTPQTTGRGGAKLRDTTGMIPGAVKGLGQMLGGAAYGAGTSIAGAAGDINELGQKYVQPYLPQSVQQGLQSLPAAPTTQQVQQATAPIAPTSQTGQMGSWMGQNVLAPVLTGGAGEAGEAAQVAKTAAPRIAEAVAPTIAKEAPKIADTVAAVEPVAQRAMQAKKAPQGVLAMATEDTTKPAQGLDLSNPNHLYGTQDAPLASKDEFNKHAFMDRIAGNRDYAGHYLNDDGNMVFEGSYPSINAENAKPSSKLTFERNTDLGNGFEKNEQKNAFDENHVRYNDDSGAPLPQNYFQRNNLQTGKLQNKTIQVFNNDKVIETTNAKHPTLNKQIDVERKIWDPNGDSVVLKDPNGITTKTVAQPLDEPAPYDSHNFKQQWEQQADAEVAAKNKRKIADLENMGTAEAPFQSKADFDKANFMNKIAGNPHEGHYLDENGDKVYHSVYRERPEDSSLTNIVNKTTPAGNQMIEKHGPDKFGNQIHNKTFEDKDGNFLGFTHELKDPNGGFISKEHWLTLGKKEIGVQQTPDGYSITHTPANDHGQTISSNTFHMSAPKSKFLKDIKESSQSKEDFNAKAEKLLQDYGNKITRL